MSALAHHEHEKGRWLRNSNELPLHKHMLCTAQEHTTQRLPSCCVGLSLALLLSLQLCSNACAKLQEVCVPESMAVRVQVQCRWLAGLLMFFSLASTCSTVLTDSSLPIYVTDRPPARSSQHVEVTDVCALLCNAPPSIWLWRRRNGQDSPRSVAFRFRSMAEYDSQGAPVHAPGHFIPSFESTRFHFVTREPARVHYQNVSATQMLIASHLDNGADMKIRVTMFMENGTVHDDAGLPYAVTGQRVDFA